MFIPTPDPSRVFSYIRPSGGRLIPGLFCLTMALSAQVFAEESSAPAPDAGAPAAAAAATDAPVAEAPATAIQAAAPAADAAPADAGSTHKPAIEEMVVTAQRREANMQDVPVAITAASAEDMAAAQVQSVADIQRLTPSAKFASSYNPTSANISIRGIGTVGAQRAFEGAVGVFIDGAYRVRPGQALQNFLDIESMQILRGPQGTLFGKNTSAGAILLTSKEPSTKKVEGDYELMAGNYDLAQVKAAINTPITDDLAVRIAGMWGQRDGFIENPNGGNYNDSAPRTGKFQVLWKPSDSFKALLVADYSQESNNCCFGQVTTNPGPLQPAINNFTLANGLKLPSTNVEDYQQTLNYDTDQQLRDKGAVLTMEWVLDSGQTLTSITSGRNWKFDQYKMDSDFTGADLLMFNDLSTLDNYSQEFTLSGDVGAFGPLISSDYVIGLYYGHEKLDATYQLNYGTQAQAYFDLLGSFQSYPAGTFNAPTGLWNESLFHSSSESKAIFTHWNLNFSDQLGMGIGLRYSRDDKNGQMRGVYYNPAPNDAFRLPGVQPGPDYNKDFSDSAITGSLSVSYKFSENLLGYGSYNRGYKSGGINLDTTAAGSWLNNPDILQPPYNAAQPVYWPTADGIPKDPSYRSEYIDGYELGLKSDYLDGVGRTNVALFYNAITDLQNQRFINNRFEVDNLDESTVYGAELENIWLLSDVFTLDLSLTYLAEAQFGSKQNDPTFILNDRRFAQAPRLTGNVALTANQPVTQDLAWITRLGLVYTGEQYTNTSNDLTVDEQNLLNFSTGLLKTDSGLQLTIWCQNCTDQRYPAYHFNGVLQTGTYAAYMVAPLTFGMTLSGKF